MKKIFFLQFFGKDEFEGLFKLENLDLHHNQIKSIKAIKHLSVVFLSIEYNNIESILSDEVPEGLTSLNLAGESLVFIHHT